MNLSTRETPATGPVLGLVASLLVSALLVTPSMTRAAKSEDTGQHQGVLDPERFEALEFRNIGPFRGGRSTAVTGVPGDRSTFFMGSTGGGVWKTTDGGNRWTNVSDESFNVGSIGAVAVANSDTNVIYVGTGSACPRGNVSPGDGVYRSTDGGKTWSHSGLTETGQIARIRIHPQNPDIVFVAALGNIFGPNSERGVFRSHNGGDTWEKALFVGDRAGAVDLAMNPGNPRILFAAIWEAERQPWTFESGGDKSGLYRSTDGGATWDELTEGLPEGDKGRIGVSVSTANPNRVWALVEAEKGGLFLSDDGGDEFRLINPDRNFRQRAWYYTHVFADTKDADTVYILNTGLWRSIDGGKSFSFIRAPHGDHHDLWIDPEDPQLLINGNDGGANVSYNGGVSWSTQANQPTAEMYRVSVDHQFPYRVYGCQQDNSCVSIPSRTSSGSIGRTDWYEIGGCESGHVAIDPGNPNITYSGCYGGQLSRYDHATDQEREVMAYPQLAVGQAARDLKYRFQWNAPTRISPHDPKVLYHTSQFVHRSTDEGQSWMIISPDLTRNDLEKQDYAGGTLTWDNTGVEVYGTIFAFEESPHTAGILWAGTDDGLVHLSRDNGETWTEITPAGIPDFATVNMIELSAHADGRAFLAVQRYRSNDFRPFIFRTDDFGSSWDLLTDGNNGIPEDQFVRVVREDPDRRGLLYAGTEFGLYLSFDDGATWESLQQNLPVTPITDLTVTQQDLVVATQGRSFWILDDLSPLHQISDELLAADFSLLEPHSAYRFGGGFSFGNSEVGGKNPPGGALLYYWLGTVPEAEIVLEILDGEGNALRTLSSQTEEPQAPNPWQRFLPEMETSRKLSIDLGLNRYVWDLRLADAEIAEDAVLWGLARGPKVPPGDYQVRLTIGDWSDTTSFEILKDPRLATTQEEFQAQYALSRKIWEALSESHTAVAQVRDVSEQITELTARLEAIGRGEGLAEAAHKCKQTLSDIEATIYQTKNESSQDILNFPPKLDNQLLDLLSVVQTGDAGPTDGAYERFQDLRVELDAVESRLQEVLDTDVAEFSELVAGAKVPAVIVPNP